MHGQPPSKPDGDTGLARLPKRFVTDEISIWTSPFRKSSYQSLAVKRYLVPFALLTAGLIATDTRTANALPNTKDQTRWSGRVSQAGAWYSVTGAGALMYLTGRITGDGHARETGILALEALGHTQVAVFAMKQLSNRERPPDYSRGAGFWGGGTSFPSGHAASAFAVAAIFAQEYREHPVVPIAAYSAAGAVALSRVGARWHWLSDVVAGGSLGYMMGRQTYRRHHDPALSAGKAGLRSRLMPEVGLAAGGPALQWSF